MKWIKYQICCNENDDETILLDKKIGYSEANITIAENESYDGSYEIIEDDKQLEEKPLAIEFGGTAARTKEEARKNLGVDDKADTVQFKAGKIIAAKNSAYTPLKGLKLYGRTTRNGTPSVSKPVPLECVGSSGSIDVILLGKNVLDYRAAYARNNDSLSIEEEEDCLYWSGKYYFHVTFNFPVGATIVFNCESEIDDNRNCIQTVRLNYADGETSIHHLGVPVKIEKPITHVSFRSKYSTTATDGLKVWNLQAEIVDVGETVDEDSFEYQQYKAAQVLTVPTPGGLRSVWSVRDEVDFEKGVLIRRTGVIDSYTDDEDVSTNYISSTGQLSEGATVIYVLEEPEEIALPELTLEAYKKLHTNSGGTTFICNSMESEDMEVTYYTPSTAVQMVHNPNDSGKILAIDEHGCVVSKKASCVIQSGLSGTLGYLWGYRLWESGIAECWIHSVFESNEIPNPNSAYSLAFPFVFKSKPQSQITFYSSWRYDVKYAATVTEKKFSYTAAAFNEEEELLQEDIYMNAYFIGRWK